MIIKKLFCFYNFSSACHRKLSFLSLSSFLAITRFRIRDALSAFRRCVWECINRIHCKPVLFIFLEFRQTSAVFNTILARIWAKISNFSLLALMSFFNQKWHFILTSNPNIKNLPIFSLDIIWKNWFFGGANMRRVNLNLKKK